MIDQDDNTESRDSEHYSADRYLVTGGYIFLAASCTFFTILAISLFIMRGRQLPESTDITSASVVIKFLIGNYTAPILLLFGAIISGLFGKSLLKSSGTLSKIVIPRTDYGLLSPLIKDSNEMAISQYIRLSSLSGFTGNFTKLGFTGLPLATISLTIIFSFLSLLDTSFMDLAKLTLGAFIGSFVQKGVSDRLLDEKENRT